MSFTIRDVSPGFNWLYPEVQRRQVLELKVLETAIARILATGRYELRHVDYDDDRERVSTIKEACEAAFAVDDCHVVFNKLDSDLAVDRVWFRCVFGNDGYDLLADWNGLDTDFDAILSKLSDDTNVWQDAEGGAL